MNCIKTYIFNFLVIFLITFIFMYYLEEFLNPHINNSKAYISIPASFDFSNYIEWEKINNFLIASNFKYYIFKWNGLGGYTFMGRDFIKAVKLAKLQGKIIIFNVQEAASMHAFALCYGSIINYSKESAVMFHLPGAFYRNQIVKEPLSESSYTLEPVKECVNKNILTFEDVAAMYAGKEVYKFQNKTFYLEDERM